VKGGRERERENEGKVYVRGDGKRNLRRKWFTFFVLFISYFSQASVRG
jgi:hypothetical protein